MNYDQSIIARVAADRQYAFRSTAAADHHGGHHPVLRPDINPLQRAFATSRPRRSSWGRRWST